MIDPVTSGDDVAARWFRGRQAALGTMHGKERAVAPILGDRLGLRVVVPPGLDTDRFGTFTRDVARAGDQVEAARRKAQAAMDATGLDLGIASEGAFGPHPDIPWMPADLEIVLLVDRRHDLEIVGRHVTLEAVSGHAWVADPDEAEAAANGLGFPEHAVVARLGPDDPRDIVKGIAEARDLRRAVAILLAASPERRVFLETDLRAHVNPTRMAAIARAADDLAATALRACPACATPGFAVVGSETGLPCAWCETPTGLVRALRLACPRCDHAAEAPRPDGRRAADPGECPRCNP